MPSEKKHEYLKLDSSNKNRHPSRAWTAKKRAELARLKKREKLSAKKKKSAKQKAQHNRIKRKIKRLEALREKTRKERERAKRRKKIRAMLEAMLRKTERNRKNAIEAKKHGVLGVQEIETLEGKTKLQPAKTAENEQLKPSEFYITIVPGEIALIEKSRRMKPGKTSRALRKAVEKNSSFELMEAKLRAVEEQLNELLEAYGLSQSKVKLPSWREPMLSLTELDKRITKELSYKPARNELSKQNLESMKQRAIEIAEQARLHRALFDATRIYTFVQSNGSVHVEEIASTLNLETKTVKECSELLKKRGLVETDQRTSMLSLSKKAKTKTAKGSRK